MIRKLRGNGFDVEEEGIRRLEEGAWAIGVHRGGRRGIIYLAVLGFEKGIEENLSKLIRLLYSEDVDPDKGALNKWLRSRELSDEDLVRRASRSQIEQSFPSLSSIFAEIKGLDY